MKALEGKGEGPDSNKVCDTLPGVVYLAVLNPLGGQLVPGVT